MSIWEFFCQQTLQGELGSPSSPDNKTQFLCSWFELLHVEKSPSCSPCPEFGFSSRVLLTVILRALLKAFGLSSNILSKIPSGQLAKTMASSCPAAKHSSGSFSSLFLPLIKMLSAKNLPGASLPVQFGNKQFLLWAPEPLPQLTTLALPMPKIAFIFISFLSSCLHFLFPAFSVHHFKSSKDLLLTLWAMLLLSKMLFIKTGRLFPDESFWRDFGVAQSSFQTDIWKLSLKAYETKTTEHKFVLKTPNSLGSIFITCVSCPVNPPSS